MSPITLPIILTIAIIGIIAIVLVKLFYEDDKHMNFKEKLVSIANERRKRTSAKKLNKAENLEGHSFVSKSWEEPMNQKTEEEREDLVTSKVFQEPMDSKHQDIISHKADEANTFNHEDYALTQEDYPLSQEDYALNQENNIPEDEIYDEMDNSIGDPYTQNSDIPHDNEYEEIDMSTEESYYNEDVNRDINEYEEFDEDRNRNIDDLGITKGYIDDDDLYNTGNTDEMTDINIDHPDTFDNVDNNEVNIDNSFNSSAMYENYDSYEEKYPLEDLGGLKMSEEVVIGGRPYVLVVGKEIIFNHNGETYSSKILEIKHENLKVMYRLQEKWISFSDIKKVF